MRAEVNGSRETRAEARRQIEICNACRYCEGYCSVFPALMRERSFSDADIIQFANLCHNCRGCYYACQYTEPHEFALNLPKVLAEARQDSWREYAWPRPLANLFHERGVALALAVVAGIAVIIGLARLLAPTDGEGFYAYLSHGAMVAIFLPAFVLPLVAVAVSLRRYWTSIGGGTVRLSHVIAATRAAATMKDLDGGHGDGCNFEDEDRYSNGRRHAHQAVLYGFLLCFASTSVATLMHYILDMPAPYPIYSLPKLLGLLGGILLCLGTAVLALLKVKADRSLGDVRVWGGEMAFTGLVFLVAASGLLLYAATGTSLVMPLLALHLGAVLAFFLATPFSKMMHGFYRCAALVKEAATSGLRHSITDQGNRI